jgi:hypothetical protein
MNKENIWYVVDSRGNLTAVLAHKVTAKTLLVDQQTLPVSSFATSGRITRDCMAQTCFPTEPPAIALSLKRTAKQAKNLRLHLRHLEKRIALLKQGKLPPDAMDGLYRMKQYERMIAKRGGKADYESTRL